MASATVTAPYPAVASARAENVPTSTAAPVGYFQQALPANLILLSFLFLTVPLAAITVLRPDNLLMWIYVWLFGMTHFVITFAIYGQSRNVRHFASTWRNRLLFFVVPVAIFVGFDLLHAFKIGAQFPVFALVFWGAVRLLDFNHFNRQSFGVYQLYKGRTGVRFPVWVKKTENALFCVLTGLLFVTFLAGGWFPLFQSGGWLTVWAGGAGPEAPVVPLDVLQAATVVGLVVAVGLFAAAVGGLWRVWVAAGRPDGMAPALLYLLVQTLSAAMSIISFPLYLAALAVHYVEYHVLMIPRCFHVPLDNGSRLDRVFGRLRAHRGLFYLMVVAVAGLVTAGSIAGMGVMGRTAAVLDQPFDYLVLIAVFDGLFVFHYFFEMLIWRFSDPFFRKTLVGFYFAPKAG
ncbi:hypothetical protein [Fimbriiglobus ruber]|uniref:Transmembrane protein n=1 Tax=Fimbriiglobus ruber TaxID=1908690 RepID=A0A225DC40_9BACT|nr:hypothetical protein [Fimbriiglobus ruber]OWK38553.1 hypothetical protein FRUB_07673 [Fimbriiglobus ruber]